MNNNLLEDELERLDSVIKASENWSKQYEKSPELHAKLIKNEAKLERALRAYFKDYADRVPNYINWNNYHAVKAYDIQTIIDFTNTPGENQTFMNVIFEGIATATTIGAQSGEDIYKIPLGLSSASSSVQQAAAKTIAKLVGMRVDKEGNIIENPNPAYSITDTIRNDIRQSIRTSIGLGEDQSAAVGRLQNVISDTRRATRIAQTETVNAYQSGLRVFGDESGAVGKVWQDVSATDVCADYADLGPVEFDFDYDGSGLMGPTAHPGCRCGQRLIYQKEWDELNN